MSNPNYIPIQSTPPLWLAEPLNQNTIMPVPVKLDAAQFNAVDAVKVTVAANTAQGLTSVPVTALSGAIPSGTVIDFGGAKFARTAAAAAINATSLTVAALPTALVANDTATYKGIGKKSLPSGTLIGRTFTERDSSAPWGPADVTTPDDEIYLTVRDNSDLSKAAHNEILAPKTKIKENYLPGWANYSTAAKAAVRARYTCIGGKD